MYIFTGTFKGLYKGYIGALGLKVSQNYEDIWGHIALTGINRQS